METFFRVIGPRWGETTGNQWIPSQKAHNAVFDIFFDVCLSKRLKKEV